MSTEQKIVWKLNYWPVKFCGRGEFVRLIFEEAGVPYEEAKEAEMGQMVRTFKGGEPLEGWPPFAPPYLENLETGFRLSQTGVICEYLGQKFGLYPTTQEDIYHARQVSADVHDFIADGRLAFHGKEFNRSYYDQKEETQPYIDRFVANRLPKWLAHFERVLKHNPHGFTIGDHLTYVDLSLLHVLRAAQSQFPEAWEKNENTPLLKEFKKRMESRDRLAAYFNSDRARKFEGNSMM